MIPQTLDELAAFLEAGGTFEFHSLFSSIYGPNFHYLLNGREVSIGGWAFYEVQQDPRFETSIVHQDVLKTTHKITRVKRD